MNNQWMNVSVLALSLSAIATTLYAEDQTEVANVEQTQINESATQSSPAVAEATDPSQIIRQRFPLNFSNILFQKLRD